MEQLVLFLLIAIPLFIYDFAILTCFVTRKEGGEGNSGFGPALLFSFIKNLCMAQLLVTL